VIDCSTFHNCEVDALYSEGDARELDGEAMAALTEHAKTCPECAERLARLRGRRNLVLSVAVEPVAGDFEARIMAAVDAALAKRAAAPPVAAAPPAASAQANAEASSRSTGATILRFMARPSFAVAATFVLVLGGAAFMMTRSGSSLAPAATTADESSPAVVAASPAASAAPEQNGQLALATAALAPPPPVATALPMPPAIGAAGAPAPAATTRAKMSRPTSPSADDRALEAAKALATAGRCSEALPKLEALSANNPEADLYAARCIAKTRGCAAAEARFDKAAQSNAGTEVGSRAQLEGAKCYQSTGDVIAARKRYEAAKEESALAAEASRGLETLDQSGASAKPGTPTGGAHASPKAVAAPRALEPSEPAKR
jgi:hypothetical protein